MSLENVVIPEEKNPKEYTYLERRAALLEKILEKGHPSFIHQANEAKYYGISTSQLNNDMKAIKKDIKENLGVDAEVVTKTVFHKAIKELQKKGEHYKAAVLAARWYDWLFDIGAKRKTPERIEVTDKTEEEKIKEAYKKVEGKTWEQIKKIYQ